MLTKAHLRMLGNICLAGVFVCLVGSLGIPAIYQICGPDEYTHAKECSNYHLPQFIFLWTVGIGDAHNGLIIAIFTGFLALFTTRLWQETKNSVGIAERALTDLERPWLLVTDVNNCLIFETAKPRLEFVLTNVGKQAGIIKLIKGGAKATLGGVDLSSINMKERHYEEVGNTIIPDSPATAVIPMKPFEGTDPIGMLRRGDAEYVIRGIIVYEGLTKQQCETGFCWRYDAQRQRLVRHGGNKYNYTH